MGFSPSDINIKIVITRLNFIIKRRSSFSKMQTKLLSDKELVKICMEELSQKAGFDDIENLVQRDFEFLSNAIESKTSVLISLSTIKRLFNGQFSRLPQVATLDAISIFIGYNNWQDFKISKKQTQNNGELFKSYCKKNGHETSKRKINRAAYFILGGLLFSVSIALIAWLKFQRPAANNFEKAGFSAVKTTANDIPNTVVFNYNLDEVKADSFFIQQSWDKNRREKIDKKKHTLTDIYYEPGYHIAKLIANDQVIKTVDVNIPTDKWVYYAKEQRPGSLPKYISSSGHRNGSLQVTKEEVVNSLIDVEKENLFLMVYFPSLFENSSDNFILRCRVKINEVKNNVCPFLMCEVFCQRNFMYFKTKPKGCSNEINAQFSDNLFDGKTTDLSGLAADVTGWQNIEFAVRGKKVSIKINDRDVFSTQYKESAGLITGLGFISNGLPEVDFVSLQTPDGKDIYQNNFDKE
jgi:hypothetical protein